MGKRLAKEKTRSWNLATILREFREEDHFDHFEYGTLWRISPDVFDELMT